MGASHHRSWVRGVIVAGVLYSLVGIVFALPASHVRVWRIAAWSVCALAYAAHIRYEQRALDSAARSSAPLVRSIHVALGVAFGAFGLAVSANIHSLWIVSPNGHRQLLLLALVIWPVMTALPAFLVSLAAYWVMARLIE